MNVVFFNFTQGGVMTLTKDPKKNEFEGMGRNEIRAALRKRGRLTVAEAALFLNWSARTLYNRISLSKSDPSLAPRGTKKGSVRSCRIEFQVTDLEAFEKSRAEMIGA
jgi:hypothetical protein